VAGAVAGYLALREFREGLYRCLTARPDALFELTDAISCADHAVTSLVQLSLVPEFRRGHGALYAALADGRIDEEALAVLLTGTLPQLVDADEGRAWIEAHDTIDYELLEQALAQVPAEQAAQVREACARWSRLRRLTAGHGGRAAPLVVFDAGYSAAALTAALAGHPVHLLVRLPLTSVFCYDPVTWPGKHGRPGKHGTAVTCHNDPGEANPEPDEPLILPDTPLYGTVRVDGWHQVHPLIHGDRGWFTGWDGELPILRGTVLRVIVEHLPDGRRPHKTMWLNTPSNSPRAPSASPRPRSAPPSRPTAGSAWSWPRTHSSCSPARSPLTCAAPGKNTQIPPGRCLPGGSAAGLPASGPC